MRAILGEIETSLPGNLTATNLGELITQADEKVAELKRLRSQTTTAVEEKRDTFKQLNEFMKRVRSGAKSAFGDDSLEYERVGGRRTSERKKHARKEESSASA